MPFVGVDRSGIKPGSLPDIAGWAGDPFEVFFGIPIWT